MNDIEKRARELLARFEKAKRNERGHWCDARAAVDAGCDVLPSIIAALTPPECLIRKESEEKKGAVCGGMAASGADGFVLVPRELTHEMYCAFVEQWFAKRRAIDDAEMDDCYAAMLAARPEVSP